MILLTNVGNHSQCGEENRPKTSYFGLILPFMEKQSEYLFIRVYLATYRIDYSLEILANV